MGHISRLLIHDLGYTVSVKGFSNISWMLEFDTLLFLSGNELMPKMTFLENKIHMRLLQPQN